MSPYAAFIVFLLLTSACSEGDKTSAPTTLEAWSEARAESTKLLVDNFAHNAYAQWALDADQRCPESLEALSKYLDKKPVDPAGAPLVMVCGDDAPPEANGFGVLSVGADGKRGTDDDIASWKPLR